METFQADSVSGNGEAHSCPGLRPPSADLQQRNSDLHPSASTTQPAHLEPPRQYSKTSATYNPPTPVQPLPSHVSLRQTRPPFFDKRLLRSQETAHATVSITVASCLASHCP